MAKSSGEQAGSKSAREKAAAARAEAQSAEKRRERMIRIVGAIGVLVVVVGIIGVAVFARSADSGNTDGRALPDVNPAAALPTGVLGSDSEFPYALPYGNAERSAPVLQLWEDFQCPACAQLELINGSGIKELANTGQVQLLFRPTAFLDRNLNNTSSAEAINAWGCAIDEGKTAEYSGIVFANQPAEGAGFSLDQLIGFGEQAGLTGAAFDSFSQCVNDGTYLGWAVNSTDVFYADEVRGTPTGVLNGEQLSGAQLADQAELQRLVDEASGN